MDFAKIASELPFLKSRTSVDGITAFDCPARDLPAAAKTLRDEFEFQELCDIASLDYGARLASNRFGAVYHFYSHTKKAYIRLAVVCESVEKPVIPSLCGIYSSADWFEREAFDMMGIVFEGHPRLVRILMWDSYPYNPLRKDFPLEGKPAPLPPSFEGNEDAVKISPASEEGGPFHSPSGGVKFSAEREPRSVHGETDNM